MSEKYRPVRGDRVRVVVEAEVGYVYPGTDQGFSLALSGASFLVPNGAVRSDEVTVEKLEPLVEVFKPGDVVRDKHSFGGYEYVITPDGYVEKIGHRWYRRPGRNNFFTSRNYEKIA